mgnify:FL=1|tara:strand:+ start:806 stop:1333 length:528 start_codon:yes stop_codon:yes gene_type:complete
MQVKKTKFKDLLIIDKTIFKDKRGLFKEIIDEKRFKRKFIFDYISFSNKNVLRGLHIQIHQPQGKLITVFQGKIFDVALDLRKKSKTYGKTFKTILSDKKNQSIYIPAGFAHGFCVLENKTLMHYKCTASRDIKSEKGIIWNDKILKIKWPITNPILSVKDKKNLTFTKFQELKW